MLTSYRPDDGAADNKSKPANTLLSSAKPFRKINMRVGIVGHASDKFTTLGMYHAHQAILDIFHNKHANDNIIVVSGDCPLGGVDKWAEYLAFKAGIPIDIKSPKQHRWDGEYGFKQRNLDIAKDSDIIYVILSDSFPPEYNKKKFPYCYHCKTDAHIKSGGCWTAHQAIKMGKKAEWIIVKNS